MSEPPIDLIASFMDDYFAESEEHLASVRRCLLLLEPVLDGADPPSAAVEELFRSFHSLKGISAMVELREAERLAHEMEACLGAMRDQRFVLSAAAFDALIEGTNLLDRVIGARRSRAAIPEVDQQIARMAAVFAEGMSKGGASSPSAPDAARQLWKVTFTPSPDLVARGVKVDTVRARLSQIGRIDSVTPSVTGGGGIAFDFIVAASGNRPFAPLAGDGIAYERLSGAPAGEALADIAGLPTAAPRAMDAAPAEANFVRVDLSRLDDLMRLVGDLVVSRARLEEGLLRVERFMPSAEWRRLQQETESIERQIRDLREGVMRVRLVPVAKIFRRMPFVVRDLARDSEKRVQLELSGQATEIDKFLIERMMDPILHLVRNAVSHGIEAPDERVAAGKRPEGTIRLAATTVGESVVLEISDDGRGMDAAAIAKRARASGVPVVEGDVDARALLDLICAPGFSTRDEADRISGRGVGMAVVRETVQDLGGALTVETIIGRGTTFRAVLPLTLAITDALIINVGERTFAVPQSAVHEVAEIDTETLRPIEGNELMMHRGAAIPVVRLARLFSLEAPPLTRMHVLLVGTGQGAVGILVDRISGQREIVVKTLSDPLVKVAGVSGATELGDGRLILILDVGGLTRSLRRRIPRIREAV
jgi:two-component system chemotaxis sensor kinase CheA